MFATNETNSGSAMTPGQDGVIERVPVHVRVRPCQSTYRCLDALVEGVGTVQTVLPNHHVGQRFHFDSVMNEWCTQKDVYASVVQPLLSGVLEGKSAAVLCYGQTGSGKTHTMIGEHGCIPALVNSQLLDIPDEAGIAVRACVDLFSRIDNAKANGVPNITVSASFLEIYCEHVYDLLQREDQKHGLSQSARKVSLNIAGGAKDTITVKDAQCVHVTSAESAVELLRSGMAKRITACTKSNSRSSRSHAVFILTVEVPSTLGRCIHGQFYLCDLAGSEKLKKTGASGLQLREAANINTSLLSLHMCIERLASRHAHVPYRNSKLTRLLQNALGGSGRACMICNVNPSATEYEETMSTLRFGRMASAVENHVTVNISDRHPGEWNALLLDAHHKIRQLRSRILQMEQEKMSRRQAGCQEIIGLNVNAGKRATPCSGGICPLTGLRFVEPVVACDGFSYERSAIEELLRIHTKEGFSGNICSPVTGDPFSSDVLIPNKQLVSVLTGIEVESVGVSYCMVSAGPDRVDCRVGLPDDVLIQILSFLPGYSLAACSMTCSRIRSLADREQLWSTVLDKEFSKSLQRIHCGHVSQHNTVSGSLSKAKYIELYRKSRRKSCPKRHLPQVPATDLKLLFNKRSDVTRA